MWNVRVEDCVFGAISHPSSGDVKGITENGIPFIIGCIKCNVDGTLFGSVAIPPT